LNESFLNNRTRHVSHSSKTPQSQQFLYEVFDLLELDYSDYTETGFMSYACLIDPINYFKSNAFKVTRSSEERRSSDDGLNENDNDNDDDLSIVTNSLSVPANDSIALTKSLPLSYKKGEFIIN
jgi:hypothetical protein